jgi:hypothetical protein
MIEDIGSSRIYERKFFPSRLVTDGGAGEGTPPGSAGEEPIDEVVHSGSDERELALRARSSLPVTPQETAESSILGTFRKLVVSGMAALTFLGAIAGASVSSAQENPPFRDAKEVSKVLDSESEKRAAETRQNSAENPSSKQIRTLLESSAKKHGVPREIVLAIAWHESGWKHYDDDGSIVSRENFNKKGTHVSTDWGIMQINDRAHPDAFPRAKTDIKYNIDFGVSLLKSLYRENGTWNKAIKAYNGSGAYVRKINRVMSSRPWPKSTIKAHNKS